MVGRVKIVFYYSNLLPNTLLIIRYQLYKALGIVVVI
jgi:hypothetical protein